MLEVALMSTYLPQHMHRFSHTPPCEALGILREGGPDFNGVHFLTIEVYRLHIALRLAELSGDACKSFIFDVTVHVSQLVYDAQVESIISWLSNNSSIGYRSGMQFYYRTKSLL